MHLITRFKAFTGVVLAVVIALAMTGFTTSPASARAAAGHADVAFTLQSGLANQDITDLLLANAGTVSDPGICKLYAVSGNTSDPVIDPNWADVHLIDNRVMATLFVSRTDVTLTMGFRTCDDPPDVRNVATITSLATYMLKVKPTKPHSCTLKVSNPQNTKVGELQFGTFKNGKPDGVVAVNPGETVTINVVRTTLDFYGYVDTGALYDWQTQAYAGYGQLKGIKVTKYCKQHATGLPPGFKKTSAKSAFAKTWARRS